MVDIMHVTFLAIVQIHGENIYNTMLSRGV